MAFALQNSTTEEQRSVIRFLTAEGEKPAAIHRRMVTVYGEKCVSNKSVTENGVPVFVQAVRVWVSRDQARQTLSSRVISSTRWTT
ncbi:hypothetical protein TNIN_377991 [Trichonephila inaurata madagascariensis]|uniref:Mos1 transposase HTH domain-containing protein n=1 Tax=Trichonephila inaurata madagascariensis TaxID=2747483 RepID=A0A8X6IP47_9ARAC|nr:hypothetical protein TNIN_377991 [Trichonephila inaurata madagascariensis]